MGKRNNSERMEFLKNDFNANFIKPLKQRTGIKFNKNRFGYDFWCSNRGVGINIYDKHTNKQRRTLIKDGIIVYYIKGFDNGDLYDVIKEIEKEEPRGVRRQRLGLSTNHPLRKKQIENSNKGFYELIGLKNLQLD